MTARIVAPLLTFVAAASAIGAQPPPEVAIEAADSVLAVVTHKAGFASGMAHDHLVVARDFEARVAFSPERPEATSFAVEVPVAELVVDDPVLQERWFPEIAALGVLAEPFGRPSEEDRVKIRKAMLGRGQLDVERHPRLAARLVGIAAEPSRVGSVEHAYRLTVEVSLHGVTRRETFTGRLLEGEGGRRLEAVGVLRSSDYGIEPYSAFLGAVKNRDELHVLVSLALAG